ncbi:MAG: hypothetical protein ACI4Q6_08630 [Huintestinicola sp.]
MTKDEIREEDALSDDMADEQDGRNKAVDIITLRRTAGEAKRHKVIMRVISVLLVVLIALVAAAYALSYFYDKFGSFTVMVNKYDMVNQGLTLSETPEFEKSIAVLNADIVYDMTNISGADLPANIDRINGVHNGDNYIAYTFYLINSGEDTVAYNGVMDMDNITNGVDEAIRVAVYKNGEKTVYGKTKSDGTGKEKDCDFEFESSTVVMSTKNDSFSPDARDKYTVVIWLEGNDPDCVDDIIGGTMKLSMKFTITENT